MPVQTSEHRGRALPLVVLRSGRDGFARRCFITPGHPSVGRGNPANQQGPPVTSQIAPFAHTGQKFEIPERRGGEEREGPWFFHDGLDLPCS